MVAEDGLDFGSY